MTDHVPDWRVDPNQVIVSLRDVMRVRVCCAICTRPAWVETPPSINVDPQRVETWRPFVFKSDDRVIE